MVNRGVWFEREFTLGLPVWMFPNVAERLRGTPARVEDMLRGVAAEILTRRDSERWSIQEHLGHLLDLGSLDAARVLDYTEGREVLAAADLKNTRTHEANHNARGFGELLAEFRAERGELVRRLEAFDDETIARTALHPRLKQPMSVTDWAYFVAEHDDHHLAAMTELLRKFGTR
ncbi:MAG TPA: DinB family protein [Pyrinomonadaceae bacterium]|nr:DinB family protein [Pyrinomonadaceae bacterium]